MKEGREKRKNKKTKTEDEIKEEKARIGREEVKWRGEAMKMSRSYSSSLPVYHDVG